MADNSTNDIKGDLKNIERLRVRSYFVRLTSLLGVGTFFNGFDIAMIGSILPALVIYLHIGFVQAGDIAASVFIGTFVGSITMGALSEKYGRKTAFIISIIQYGVLGMITGIGWNFTSIYILRLLSGFGLGGEVPIAATLMSEWAPSRKRGLIVLGYESVYAWGLFAAPLVATGIYAIFGMALGWRIMFFLLAIPAIVGVVCIFTLWESPRWLLNKGKMGQARILLEKMEKRPKSDKVEKEAAEVDKAIEDSDTTPKATRFGELFSKQYRRRTGFNWIMWITGYFVANGLLIWLPEEYVSIGNLPVSMSLELTAVTAGISLITIYPMVFSIDRVGRKTMALIGYSFAIIGLVFGLFETLIYHNVQWPVLLITSTFGFVGLGGILILLLYTYTAELFPTRMRGWATSAGNAILWIAGIVGVETVGLILASGPTTIIGLSKVFITFLVIAVFGAVITAVFGIETKQKLLENLSP